MMLTDPMLPYPPIGDYAIIGDCRSAALVARDGALAWLCWPRFDSPALFSALLDAEAGGRFSIRATGAFQTVRRYRPETNVLETVFRSASGAFVLRDCMPVSSDEHQRGRLTPDHEVLREVEGLEGVVTIEVLYDPRPAYGGRRATLKQRGALGLWCAAGGPVLLLRSDLPLTLSPDGLVARGTAQVRAGERHYFSLSFSEDAPAVVPLLGPEARGRLQRTEQWWQAWAQRCRYHGPYRDAVVRSALVLKLMAYAPSGAVVAAPTTSLPEQLGGPRNWDYRYCWLRDASLTLRALFALGYDEEAEAFLNWLLHATRLTQPELQVVYNVYGEARLPEHVLPHLTGYAGSRPVRVGNDAHSQLQLDVYGEVIDAAARFADRGGRFDKETARLLNGLGQTVCRRWREPDDGIWEARSGRMQHTLSKVLCWVALDRLVRLHEAGHTELSAHDFRRERDAIRQLVESRGYNERLQTYTRTLDGDEVDASLLLLPLYGYVAAADRRMQQTVARIQAQLARGSLLYRYALETDDGLPPGEGAFGICSFWAVECLARAGEQQRATRAFEELLGYANEVDLYAEEIDPETGHALGNFPQAFTHVGLINAALALDECGSGGDWRPLAQPPAMRREEQS